LRVSSEKEKAELQDMSVPMKKEESVTYGDPVVVFVRVGDPSACADVRRPKAPKMALPEGIVDVDEPNVDDPKAGCEVDVLLVDEVARVGAGTEVVIELENKRLDEGERTPAEEKVDKKESEVGETSVEVGHVKWVAVAFAVAAKHGAGVACVRDLEVAARTDVESGGAGVVAEVVLEMDSMVDAENVVKIEETGVKLVVVVEAGVEAAKETSLEEAPEVASESMLVSMVEGEVVEVVQTPGVEAGSGAVSGAVEECEGAGVSRMMLRIGFLNSCVWISRM
jgi:hypothetical protein